MKYEDGQIVRLGDIVDIELGDAVHRAKVVLLGDTGQYSDLDENTAKWAIESGHVEKANIMTAFVGENPFEHNDPRYAPMSNSLSTNLSGVVLVRRSGEPSAEGNAAAPRASA